MHNFFLWIKNFIHMYQEKIMEIFYIKKFRDIQLSSQTRNI